MRIILVNYRYFISGGPERYYFNVKELLERHGHEVIPFSVKSSRNLPAGDWERYFLDVVGDDQVYFSQQGRKRDPRVMLKSFSRMFWSGEARRKMEQLLRDTRPDLVYVMQMHNKISPSILAAARKCGVPVVHRISDFQYMCPNALFYNSATGVCEACLEGRTLQCVKQRCVMGSRVYSAIKMLAKRYHDMRHVTSMVDAFVVPSTFTLGRLERYGIPSAKLHHIPTFFNLKGSEAHEVSYEPFVLYVGRIERQKGLQTLVDAFRDTDMQLKVIGFSNDGFDSELRASTAGCRNIEWLGRLPFEQIAPWLSRCRCTVVPSEWYDNFPNAILESFAFGKPVVATAFGSLPELVDDGVTGLTFPYGDAAGLAAQCRRLLDDEALARRLGAECRRRIETLYSPEAHYRALKALFDTLVTNNPHQA